MTKPLYLIDSITQITADMADGVIVSGSHGGVSSASYVVNAPKAPFAVFFNDAGVGKDAAGIEALKILNDLGILAFAYGHDSARIGQAQDGLDHGVVTHVNSVAHGWASWIGKPVCQLVQRLREPS
ncbi:MAG: hypothetical protein LRY53_10220 [Burkholderiaceae bacterium]|nr:hypothetical protein [Burkholderiaceae bacterium]MCD8536243.1 hypothetical protein [Burkholderiaceae bacterium]MCD8565979.1 hypothetical protein [Burkholderiaceae bacterium]